MIVDRNYCMSSYLMFRTIADHNKTFKEGLTPSFYDNGFVRTPIYNSDDLEDILREKIQKATKDGKAALALSGGIDSAILAKCMPKGSTAYTFKCVVPGIDVVDETKAAARYAEECGLNHKVVEIYWEDFEESLPDLMKRKGAPLHSIEVQIYKASFQAHKDGFTKLIFGESADVNFGGHSGLLSKDWTFGEFIDRYSYVLPYKVLKQPKLVLEPFLKHELEGRINIHEFVRDIYFKESMGSYTNATSVAGIEFVAPYANAYLGLPLDYRRVRSGDSKYLIRELFKKMYGDFEIPEKIPMPRPMNEWLKDWEGPTRDEFWPNCTENMSGDQKWLVFCLEKFLNLIDERSK